jgi:hypothetical protein
MSKRFLRDSANLCHPDHVLPDALKGIFGLWAAKLWAISLKTAQK